MSESDAVRRAREAADAATSKSDAAARSVIELLERARASLLARAASYDALDSAWARSMLYEVDRQLALVRAGAEATLTTHLRDALAAGDAEILRQAAAQAPRAAIGIAGVSRELVEFAAADSADLVGQITDSLRRKLARSIRDASTSSLSIDAFARQIGSTLTDARRPTGIFGSIATQTERVVRTETGRVYEGAQNARLRRVAEDSGLVVSVEWVATLDGRERESHRALHGAVIPASERFNVGPIGPAAQMSYEAAQREGAELGDPASGPLDPALPAREAVNCRCTRMGRFASA